MKKTGNAGRPDNAGRSRNAPSRAGPSAGSTEAGGMEGQRGASSGTARDLTGNYLAHHLLMARRSFYALRRTPFGTGLTILVLAVTLTLPAVLYIFLENSRSITGGFETSSRISVYLRTDLEAADLQRALLQIRELGKVGRADLTTPAEALEEFRAESGWEGMLGYLEGNPLPAVIDVTPVQGLPGSEGVRRLVEELRAVAGVEAVQLDFEWLGRLEALYMVFDRVIVGLASLLAVAVLIIIGNTIRLAIQNRRDEILVLQLIGGSDAYVRRPFLYTGFWYGAASGLVAWGLTWVAVIGLQGPVRELAKRYHSSFDLRGLLASEGLMLILIGAVLGVIGAWLAVRRHLAEQEAS